MCSIACGRSSPSPFFFLFICSAFSTPSMISRPALFLCVVQEAISEPFIPESGGNLGLLSSIYEQQDPGWAGGTQDGVLYH